MNNCNFLLKVQVTLGMENIFPTKLLEKRFLKFITIIK